MTAHQDESPQHEQEAVPANDGAAGAAAPSQDPKERFRAALEAKRAGQQSRSSGAQDRDQLAGHAKDGAHGHKVFRRRSG